MTQNQGQTTFFRDLASRFVDVEAWAGPQGGTFLAMFQIPNKFFRPDGRVTDFAGNDWESGWGKVR